MNNPDRLLVEQLQQHNKNAFDTLYGKYHIAVYRNILKLTKDKPAAEDILQEVFIKLWEKRNRLDPRQLVTGWLFVISFNLSVNYNRKKLREQVMYKRLISSPIDSVSVINEEQYHLLEEAINRLTPQKRKIVTLCKLEGKTYEEAAAELNISRHTIKEHLSVAMVVLSDYIRKNAHRTYLNLLLLWLMNHLQ